MNNICVCTPVLICGLHLGLISFSAATPLVEAITMSPVIALPGTTVTLSFSVTNSLPAVGVVSSDWRQVNEEGAQTIASEDTRFTFSDDFTSLTISDIHPFDEATYDLTVTNDAGLTGSASIDLDVQCKCVLHDMENFLRFVTDFPA